MPDLELTVIPEALIRARLEACLTQAELAKVAGVRRETIYRLEGGAPARVVSIRKICAALGIRPGDITQITQGVA